MSERDRVIHPVVGVLAAVFLILMAAGLVSHANRYHPNSDGSRQTSPNQLQDSSHFSGQSSGAEQPTPEQRKEAREEADILAQYRMAAAAEKAVYVSALALFGLGFTVFYARRAWKSATTANASFVDASDKQLRAYVSAKVIAKNSAVSIDLSQSQPVMAKIGISLDVVNFGNTPAKNVRLRSVVKMAPWPTSEESVPSVSDQTILNGPTINPGESWPLNLGVKGEFFDRWLYANPPQTLLVVGEFVFESLEKQHSVSICWGAINMKHWYLKYKHDPKVPLDFKIAGYGNQST